MKAVFLCAGKGTRMRPISYSTPKHLVPLANKPILQYNVEKVIETGITDIGLVVSPEMESLYRETLGSSKWGASISYIHQENPRGLAHAVACAREFVGEEPFLVYLGDNLLHSNLTGMVDAFRSNEPSASILLAPVDDPERFGVAEIKNGDIVNLVEKPDDPPSNLAIVGAYLFTREIFNAIERIDPSDRGELEITDAIARLIEDEKTVTPATLEGWWLDVGRPDDALEANRVLLEEVTGAIEGNVTDSEIEDDTCTVIEQGTKVINSSIKGPVHVAGGCEIVDTSIGPNVSLGKEVNLENVHVENAIIMEGTSLKDVEIVDSLIGEEVTVDLDGSSVSTNLGNQAKIVGKKGINSRN